MTVPTPASTPSGRPEVFIPNVPPDEVKTALIDRELGKGWQIYQEDPLSSGFQDREQRVWSHRLIRSQFNGIPDTRLRFTLTNEGTGTRVFLNAEMVSNPGSAFEKVYPIEDADRNAFPQLQKYLERVKSDILARR